MWADAPTAAQALGHASRVSPTTAALNADTDTVAQPGGMRAMLIAKRMSKGIRTRETLVNHANFKWLQVKRMAKFSLAASDAIEEKAFLEANR